MARKPILTIVATAALIPAAALAQHGPGGGGGPPAGVGGMGNAGGFGAGGPGGMGNSGGMGGYDFGVSTRDAARASSQGPSHASATGIANANANSVLAGTTGTSTAVNGPLTGLTVGTTLYSNGTPVGTVQQIRTAGKTGQVVLVLVQGTNGGVYAVPAGKLTYSSGNLTTTARFNGINEHRTSSR